MDAPVPANVREVSEGLQYRDFITVGLLVDRLKVKEPDGGLLKDTWIYVQEPDVILGRLQILITGVRTWWRIRRRFGLGWSISAMTRTICGRCRMMS